MTQTATESKTKLTAAQRVAEDLRRRLIGGEYMPGTLFPGRRSLGKEYDCGPLTVEAAIKTLIAEGLLRAEDRRGTFVADSIPGLGSAVLSSQIPAIVTAERDASHKFPPGGVVGVVTPTIIGDPQRIQSRHGAHEIVSAFERYISEFDGITQVFGFNDEAEHIVPILDATREAIAAGCVALLVAMHFGDSDTETLLSIAETSGVTLVFAGSGPVREPAVSVYYDSVVGGRRAAEHLVSAGARDIVFYSHCRHGWVGARASGAASAIAELGRDDVSFRTFPDDLLASAPLTNERPDHLEHSYRVARELLEHGLPGDGIIASNDLGAIGFNRAALEHGWKPGRDYMIIGFDDEPRAKYHHLSTMRPPFEAMGREAGRLLIAKLSDAPLALPSTCLHPVLVGRLSTRRTHS